MLLNAWQAKPGQLVKAIHIQLKYTTGTFSQNGILYTQEGDILGYEQKSMKHITNNIVYEKVGGI